MTMDNVTKRLVPCEWTAPDGDITLPGMLLIERDGESWVVTVLLPDRDIGWLSEDGSWQIRESSADFETDFDAARAAEATGHIRITADSFYSSTSSETTA